MLGNEEWVLATQQSTRKPVRMPIATLTAQAVLQRVFGAELDPLLAHLRSSSRADFHDAASLPRAGVAARLAPEGAAFAVAYGLFGGALDAEDRAALAEDFPKLREDLVPPRPAEAFFRSAEEFYVPLEETEALRAAAARLALRGEPLVILGDRGAGKTFRAHSAVV